MTAAPGRLHELTLVEAERRLLTGSGFQDRVRYTPRLTEPQCQLEFVVDGHALGEQLRTFPVPEPETFGLDPFDMLSVADVARPEAAREGLEQLAGARERSDDWPLAPGRLPLYVCPVCADLGCGAITVEVVRHEGVVTWQDFRMENGYSVPDEAIDLSAFGPFHFDAEQHDRALLAPVPRLQALVDDEERTRQRWRQTHGLRGLLRRWTGKERTGS